MPSVMYERVKKSRPDASLRCQWYPVGHDLSGDTRMVCEGWVQVPWDNLAPLLSTDALLCGKDHVLHGQISFYIPGPGCAVQLYDEWVKKEHEVRQLQEKVERLESEKGPEIAARERAESAARVRAESAARVQAGIAAGEAERVRDMGGGGSNGWAGINSMGELARTCHHLDTAYGAGRCRSSS